MSEITSDTINKNQMSKLYNASTARSIGTSRALTQKGELRKSYKDKGYEYDKKNKTISKAGDLLTYRFTMPSQSEDFPGYYEYTGTMNLVNNLLLKELIIDNEISGDYRLIIKRGDKIIYDKDANIDETWYENNQSEFQGDDSGTSIWNEKTKAGQPVTFIFSKNKKISKKHITQNYLDAKAVAHCILSPILSHYEKRSDKQAKSIVNKINDKIYKTGKVKEGFLSRYKNGIPQEELEKVCHDLKINIQITAPFKTDPYIDIRPCKNKKTFKFYNTRLDHVDLDDKGHYKQAQFCNYELEKVSQEEMNRIYEEVKDLYPLYKKGRYGITKLLLPDKAYVVDNGSDIITDWSEKCGLKYIALDRHNPHDKSLMEFIDLSTHFNGTVDFVDTETYDYALQNGYELPNIKHIDMKKAYSAFKECSYYCGFVGHITDFRACNTFEENGFYRIMWLDFSKNPKLDKLNKIMKIYKNYNIYTKAELDFLKENNVGFQVVKGARGETMHFSFNNEMKTTKLDLGESKLPLYSYWTGMSAMIKSSTDYYQKAQDTERPNLEVGHDVWLNEEKQEWRIRFPNKNDYTRKHITSQILAYTRLNVLEQLLNMDIDKIIRVCVDGIYYKKHDCKINNVFQDKSDKMTFRNSPSQEYISNLLEWKNTDYLEKIRNKSNGRPYYSIEMFDGEGGVGKTYYNINDKGLRDICYVPHSWKLASNQKDEKIHRATHNTLLVGKDSHKLCNQYAVYLIDECSMLSKGQQEELIEKIGGRIIFMGDPDCQLQFIMTEEDEEYLAKKFGCKNLIPREYYLPFDKNHELIQNTTTLTTQYRIKCKVLREVTKRMRFIITHNLQYMCPLYTLFPEIKTINRKELKKIYNHKEDIILVRSHKLNELYNEMFADKEKYKVLEQKNGLYNGSIVFEQPKGVRSEFRHGYTVHSVQGEDYEGKLFIDVKGMWNYGRMLYTAISRGQYAEKIYFVIP